MGGNPNAHATAKAITGRTTICPTIPSNTALGFLATPANALRSRSMPNRNISTMSMGITIHIVFISVILFVNISVRKCKSNIWKLFSNLYFCLRRRCSLLVVKTKASFVSHSLWNIFEISNTPHLQLATLPPQPPKHPFCHSEQSEESLYLALALPLRPADRASGLFGISEQLSSSI